MDVVGSDGIIESDSYGKVRVGTGETWEEVYEMPSFALNADVYSPVRLKGFAAQVEDFAGAIQSGRVVDDARCRRTSGGRDRRSGLAIGSDR